MLRTLATRQARRRKGAILIVVLAMLVLFAVLGLSFVLYSEAQLSASQSQSESINTDSPPNAQRAAEGFVGPLIYDVSNVGEDLGNPMRGNSLVRSKYSVTYDTNPASATFGQYVITYVPYGAANAMQPEPTPGFTFNTITNSREIVRFTWDTTSNSVFDPEWFYNGLPFRQGAGAQNTNLSTTANGSPQAKNYPFTYPDRHDFYLAQMDPATGRITVPSFHRPDLGNWTTGDPLNFETQGAAGKFRTLRPRVADGHTNFPPVPMDPDGVFRGDVSNMKFISATGGQQNDSFWMYSGGPVLRWRNKNYVACVAPLILDLNNRVNLSVAGNLKNTNASSAAFPHGSKEGWGPWEVNPLQLGLNTTDLQTLVQKRYGQTGATFTPPVDPYTQLAYTTRINGGKMPRQGALINADGNGPAYTAPPAVAPDGSLSLPLSGTFQTTPIFNNALVTATPFRYSPYQNDLLNLTAAPPTGTLTQHPAQYNPLVYSRPPTATPVAPAIGAGSYGHDEWMKLLARYSDPKNRQTTITGMPNSTSLTPTPDTATARQLRALTTHFSTSQQWAGVNVVAATTVAPGTTSIVRLGPIDVNRTLPDYRKNTTIPPSPVNLWSPSVAAEQPFWYAAHSARQRLARDIFIRMAARYGLINGTNAIYYTDTGNVEVLTDPAADATGNTLLLMRLAQMAVNLVDYIDNDDIVTPFVWRPTAVSAKLADPANDPTNGSTNFTDAATASRVVYGTELPRLVLNEVYGGVFNDRTEEATAPPLNRSTKPLKRRYWIELYNPTPGTNIGTPGNAPANFVDPVLSDSGAARLRYENTVTPVLNPANGAPLAGGYPGVTYNPYRIEVAVAPASTATPVAPMTPYATALQTAIATGGYGMAVSDTATMLAALPAPNTTTLMARINTFTHDPASEPSGSSPPPSTLTGDGFNVVQPASAASGTNGGNLGYYVIGPRDQFPPSGVINSLNLPDAAAGVPTAAAPVNALAFDVTTGGPAEMDITNEVAKTSVVILRRLLNPYMVPNDPANNDTRFPYNSALPPNPYITVDFLENTPTRDRAKYANGGGHTPATNTNAPTVGRIHPFAAYPDYNPAVVAPAITAVQDQVNAAITGNPPHTFFNINNPADNARGAPTVTYGFEWLVHLDRELVSLPEAALASRTSPALLTHAFFNSTATAPNVYQGHTVGLNTPISLNINGALDSVRMLTDSEGLLRVGSRLPGIPVGGREPGKVNINTVNNQAVLNAVFDPQPGNGFYTTNPTYVSTLWGTYISPATNPTPNIARTPNGTPRATVHEGGTDYPFTMGGTVWGPTTPTFDAIPPRDHPFGRRAVDNTADLTSLPVFPNYSAPPSPALAVNHPYLLNEPLQKAWNNLTPVSDSFLIVMTVGFFEVDNAGPWSVTNQPQLGKELFDKVPGDLRAQFAGIIDRSQLFTEIVQNDAGTGVAQGTSLAVNLDPSTNPVPRGVQTKLVSDVSPSAAAVNIDIEAIPAGGVRPDGTTVAANQCAILGDGVVFTVGVGSRIRVGYADSLATTNPGDGEWLTVTAVNQRMLPDTTGALTLTAAGQVTLTVSSVTRAHTAGAPVGNVLFGNPGPQPGVRLSDLQRRGVVPYFTRLEP